MSQLPLFTDETEPPTDEWTDSGLPENSKPVDATRDPNPEPSYAYGISNEPSASPSTKWVPFVAFDLEIARPFESGRPYGISCAATLAVTGHGEEDLLLWHGEEGHAAHPMFAPQMNPAEVQELAGYLIEMSAQGYQVVTFNGAGFDLDVLSEECRSDIWTHEITSLTVDHIDIGFLMMAQMGYMTKLVKLSEGLGVGTKTEGMHGDLAPYLWNGGVPHIDVPEGVGPAIQTLGVEPATRAAQDLCLEYVGQDARITADTYTGLIEQGHVYWTTQRGTRSRYPWRPETKPGRLLTVNEACKLPLPDTSWMTDGPRQTREKALAWTKEAQTE